MVSNSRRETRICHLVLSLSIGSTAQMVTADAGLNEVRLPQELSESDWSAIRAAFDAGRLAGVPVGGEYEARSPDRQWRTRFDGRGFLITPDAGNWSWGLELVSYGVAGHECPADTPTSVSAHRERIYYEWDDEVTEWYINEPRGLEHGYTVHRRPADALAGESTLRFTLAVRGELSALVQDGGRDVRFVDGRGVAVLTYSGLVVFDADGSIMPAWFELGEGHLSLVVDDFGATYPLTVDPCAQPVYLQASNAGAFDNFGDAIAMSGDTVVVGAPGEDSNATGVNGNQGNESALGSGAAYIFVRNGTTWSQQAYLKASNTDSDDQFGMAVAISGETVVIGAGEEDSSATGVNGDQLSDSAISAGAAYVFVRSGTTWSQQAYVKASNTDAIDRFGSSVAVSGDTAVVGAYGEDSGATGVNGEQASNGVTASGAAYIFVRNGTTWSQQAYLKASNTSSGDFFGRSVAVSDDTVIVGADNEDSSAVGIDGDQSSNSAKDSGAAYIFVREGVAWSQQAYVKASNAGKDDSFAFSVAISGDTAIVGAHWEDSSATGTGGDQSNDSAMNSGAAYVFVRDGTTWTQQAYLKASNTGAGDVFGQHVAVSGDTVVVGAWREDGGATGVNGDQSDNSATDSGAAYVFARAGTAWTQKAYVKASNTGAGDVFGQHVAVSGSTSVVGAPGQDADSGAIYFVSFADCCPADLDLDREIGGSDLGLLIAEWGSSESLFDLNGDALVDGADLEAMLAAWGPCP